MISTRIISDIERILESNLSKTKEGFDWLRNNAMVDISPATLQNLRITEKIHFKKIMSSYSYNKEDLQKLFEDEYPNKKK